MSRALPVVSICLALLAFAVALMPRGEPPPPVVMDGESSVSDEDLEFLKRRLEVLEDENRALWDRVVSLERRPAVSPDGGGAAAPVLEAEVARLREELRGVMTGEVLTSEAGRSALKDVIREAEQDRQRERFQEMEGRRTKQAEEQKVKWKAFVGTARLSYAAEQKLNERLSFEESERTKKMEQLRLGEQTWQEVSQYLRTQRRETDNAVGAMLDDAQKKQYQEVRRDDPSGGRGQRGGEGNRRAEGEGGQRSNRRQQQPQSP